MSASNVQTSTADLVPILQLKCFIIVNSSESGKPGSHWIFLYYDYNNMFFADQMVISVAGIRAIYARHIENYQHKLERMANFLLQHKNSEFCELFCIYIAQVIYSKRF